MTQKETLLEVNALKPCAPSNVVCRKDNKVEHDQGNDRRGCLAEVHNSLWRPPARPGRKGRRRSVHDLDLRKGKNPRMGFGGQPRNPPGYPRKEGHVGNGTDVRRCLAVANPDGTEPAVCRRIRRNPTRKFGPNTPKWSQYT